jgi:hypothetical protein
MPVSTPRHAHAHATATPPTDAPPPRTRREVETRRGGARCAPRARVFFEHLKNLGAAEVTRVRTSLWIWNGLTSQFTLPARCHSEHSRSCHPHGLTIRLSVSVSPVPPPDRQCIARVHQPSPTSAPCNHPNSFCAPYPSQELLYTIHAGRPSLRPPLCPSGSQSPHSIVTPRPLTPSKLELQLSEVAAA